MTTENKSAEILVTPNFSKAELSCPCCGGFWPSPILLTKLQSIRDQLQHPLVISSACRCQTHNKEVGGSDNSYHQRGEAVDIVTTGWNGEKKFRLVGAAISADVGGIGLYKGHVHLDIGAPRLWI